MQDVQISQKKLIDSTQAIFRSANVCRRKWGKEVLGIEKIYDIYKISVDSSVKIRKGNMEIKRQQCVLMI